jgi:hypothetical protein
MLFGIDVIIVAPGPVKTPDPRQATWPVATRVTLRVAVRSGLQPRLKIANHR